MTDGNTKASVKFDAVQKSFGSVKVLEEFNLEVEPGEFLVLLGASGSGKTTALRILSGLETPSAGRVHIGERDVTEVLPKYRDISMVFQSYALYPHMNVAANIGFALKTTGVGRSEIDSRVAQVAKILRLEPLLDRLPKQLSGGQRQRVAIGRAIIREPKGFLFDEPLSNLDAALRVNMRLEISRLHDQLGITTVYVTHDQTEAMTLADRIVVLNEGVIMQAGSPRELYSNPQNKFVAEFIGSPKMNLMPCREEDGQLSLLSAGIQNTGIPATGKDVAWLGVRPEHITLCDPKQGMLAGTIMVTEYLGSEQFVYVDCGFEDVITVRIDPAEDFEVGSNVGLMLARESLHLFDEGESRL